jgi:hypothetical protein
MRHISLAPRLITLLVLLVLLADCSLRSPAVTNAPTPQPPTAAPILPDLAVQSTAIEMETIVACSDAPAALGLSVFITNAGSADAPAFDVVANNVRQTLSAGLAAGQSARVWFAGYGEANQSVTIDPDGQIAESNEVNNQLVQRVPLPTPPPPCATDTPLPTATFTPLPTATFTPTPIPTPTLIPTPTPQPLGPGGLPYPLKTAQLEFGVAAHLFHTNRTLPLQRAQEAGFGWIRQQIHWKDLEGPPGRYAWGELDDVVAEANRAGFKLMLSIVQAPSFYAAGGAMPRNPEPLGNFVAALAAQYKGRIQAIEIWNEQNLAVENGGRVTLEDAGHYVELLKVAYTRIKEVDPSIFVVVGPPAATGVTDQSIAIEDMRYYEAMYSYQDGVIRNYFDVQAVHPGGQANPPDTLWPNNPSNAQGWTGHPTFYFRHVENVRAMMERYGLGDHQIWITEFGWATPNTTRGYEYGNQISYELQAEYIVGAMRRTKEQYPWVGAMFLWNLNFAILRAQSGQLNHEQASFGILNANGTQRPAFFAIQQYLAELRGNW